MDLKITRVFFYVALLASFFLSSCEPEYDKPPVGEIPEGDKLTIKELKEMYKGDPIRFTTDKSVFGVVTMDESSGNIYKSIYMRDHTGAINLALTYSGGLYEGDSIRVNLNGTTLNDYNGLIQIDSVDVDANVVKQDTKMDPQPKTVTLSQVDSSMQSQLVKLENVEFHPGDRDVTYADATNQEPKNLNLVDCSGNSIIVRTSGYADFADNRTPSGNGSIIGIASVFQDDIQLFIRRTSEVNMTGKVCNIAAKNFDDNSVTSGGWILKNVIGPNQTWTTGDQGSNTPYAQISGYDGGPNQNEDWLISPGFDATKYSSLYLSFRNAMNYSSGSSELRVLISTDYDGSGDPNNFTWTDLTSQASMSAGSWNWVNSGKIDISSYNSSQVHVGFKYISSSSGTETWEIDDVLISTQ